MTTETIQLSALSADPSNARRHSERNIEAIMASLRRFNQQTPLVVDANNVVRVGCGRLEAMRRLGWTHATVVRTNLTGAELASYSIADNRSGDPEVGSTFDGDALTSLLSALAAEDADLAVAAGFTPDDLASLLTPSESVLPEQPPSEFDQFGEDIPTDHECPKCKYRWSGKTAPQGAA